jgi:hypothetical protein
MRTLNERGVGLLEVMVGFGLLGVGAVIIFNGVDFISEKKEVIDKGAVQEALITSILESVRANVAREKVDFAPNDFLDRNTYARVLPSLRLCWVNDGFVPVEAYPSCPGRVGYVVTPLKIGTMEFRGLHKVTLRITHQQLFPKTYRQYEFIVKDP